jgi:hypothetical protein
MKLRTLTIMQPYAWWIVNGNRGEETGRRPTSYRGPFLVHAGQELWEGGLTPAKMATGVKDLMDRLHFGVVIGVVRLVDVIPDDAGKSVWILEDAHELTHRYASGKQNWWYYGVDELSRGDAPDLSDPFQIDMLRELRQLGFDPAEFAEAR